LDLMQYWIRGIPAPHVRAGIKLNNVPLLTQLDQNGWSVEYAEYYAEAGLPRRMNIARGDRSARIVIQTWDFGGG
ncbi:MAG: lipoprotein insertase outer membrane protein LolB, partial [Natronospirillum sp.]